MKAKDKPLVGIIMGSDSDWPTLEAAADICSQFFVPYEVHVVSAHRTPDDMSRYAKNAYKKGLKVIIAAAGGAAHLPGMVASQTPLPVIGVPVKTDALNGMDSLLSIVQMPGGVPVATVAIGAGKNAGLLAVEILATNNAKIMSKLIDYKKELAVESRNKDKSLNKELKK
jgi:5-(carboxyamino)imidazole ribonucleotide mutase